MRLLNEEIKCLQLLLSQAGIPYGKGIQEKERPAARQKDSVMSETETVREQFVIPETITQKHAQYFYSFFKGRKDVYSKEQESRPKTGKQDIIRSAGITGSRVFVRNMKKRK